MRRTWRRCLLGAPEAEAEDNSVSCVTCVSCQRAASGAPKCTICDQVCHAIIPCTSATDDKNVLEHMTSAFPAREQWRGSQTGSRVCLFFCLNIALLDIERNNDSINLCYLPTNVAFFDRARLTCPASVPSKARQNTSLYWMCRDEIVIDQLV